MYRWKQEQRDGGWKALGKHSESTTRTATPKGKFGTLISRYCLFDEGSF